jgi:hypothetical protein
MNMLIEHDTELVKFLLEESAPMGWAAHGFECGLLWFFGRSEWRVNLSRTLGPSDTVWFHVQPIGPERHDLNWSNFSTLETLLRAKAFPLRLPEVWDMSKVLSGISLDHLKEDSTIGLLAYGLADIALDFFKRGATWVRAQYSINKVQIVSNTILSEEQARDLASSRPSYVGAETVAALPWPNRRRTWDIQPGTGKSGLL